VAPATVDPGYAAALEEALANLEQGGIPIGASLVRDGRGIGRGRNRRVQAGDSTAHAEVECLRDAGRIGSYGDTVLYTTLMPCFLCSGAAALFGIPRVIIGDASTFAGEGSLEFLAGPNIVTTVFHDDRARAALASFIECNPHRWREDIGQ
jgi:cytosine deaminase